MFVGLWFMLQKNQSPLGFTVANKSIKGWILGSSLIVTYISNIAFLSMPAKAFASNWSGYVLGFTMPILAWITVRYFVPFYRKTEDICSYTHLGRKFGRWASVYAVVCYTISILAWMGTILYLISLALASMFGLSMQMLIVIVGVVVTIYTCIGGIKAVIWTDFIQCIVLIFGAIFCAILIYNKIPGDFSNFLTMASEHEKFSLGSFIFNFEEPTFWVMLVTGFTLNLQTFGIAQGFVQRYFSAKTDKDAKISVYFCAILYLVLTALFFFIGTELFVYYQTGFGVLPKEILDMGNDAVYPYFIGSMLPAGIKGLIISAILAAAMSSLDTGINSIATAIYSEIYQPFFCKRDDRQQSMKVLYIVSAILGIGAILVAEFMGQYESILDAWWQMDSVFSGGTLGLFLLAMISRKANATGAIVGVIAGSLIIVWLGLNAYIGERLPAFKVPVHSFMTLFCGTFVIIAVGLLISALKKPKEGRAPN